LGALSLAIVAARAAMGRFALRPVAVRPGVAVALRGALARGIAYAVRFPAMAVARRRIAEPRPLSVRTRRALGALAPIGGVRALIVRTRVRATLGSTVLGAGAIAVGVMRPMAVCAMLRAMPALCGRRAEAAVAALLAVWSVASSIVTAFSAPVFATFGTWIAPMLGPLSTGPLAF
jgi:hypothetical protein